MPPAVSSALVFLISGLLNVAAGGQESAPSEFRLANGLQVILRPIQECPQAAVIVLYSIGEEHDPEGKSGLGHLIEHLYVTAAAGEAKARTAEEFMGRAGGLGNAQTGDDYTVIASVVPRDDLENELVDAAARMSALRLEAADLKRERPRLLQEVSIMFGGSPPLDAMNRAQERLRPSLGGGRKGGAPDQIIVITLDEMRARLDKYYKPSNAILSIAGGFDEKAIRRIVQKHFAGIPAGEAAPQPRKRPEPKTAPAAVEEIPSRSLKAGVAAEACVAYRAPLPQSKDYAPFLILVERLWVQSSKFHVPQGRFPVIYTPIDNPAVLFVGAPFLEGESSQEAIARLESFASSVAGEKLSASEAAQTLNGFGYILGIVDLPEAALKLDPYGTAFSLGRRKQMGLDAIALRKAIQSVTAEDLRRAAKTVFAIENRAAVVVKPR